MEPIGNKLEGQTKVRWFKPRFGYGFLEGDNEDIFVHSSVISMEGYKTLKAGQTVTYEAYQTNDGVRATKVTPIG